jgi:hypothetical protein
MVDSTGLFIGIDVYEVKRPTLLQRVIVILGIIRLCHFLYMKSYSFKHHTQLRNKEIFPLYEKKCS